MCSVYTTEYVWKYGAKTVAHLEAEWQNASNDVENNGHGMPLCSSKAGSAFIGRLLRCVAMCRQYSAAENKMGHKKYEHVAAEYKDAVMYT